MFETDSLPSGWLTRLQFMDEIWVPTEHARKIFIHAGLNPINVRILEEPVDTDFFSPLSRGAIEAQLPDLSIPTDATVFLFVGKFEQRKGIDLLLQAYFSEFKRADNALLLLLTSPYHSSPSALSAQLEAMASELGIALDSEDAPEYRILTDVRQANMPALYSLAQALVIPSHGEGWGRPHMEAMACQTPVIATNWSGPAAFIDAFNGYPVAIEEQLVSAR